jgi:hypothetical protein
MYCVTLKLSGDSTVGERLTERQTKFAKTLAVTGDKQLSAREAGYARPQSEGYKAAESQNVYAMVLREQHRILVCDAVPAAVACLVSIVRDPLAPTGARVNASKVILDRAYATAGAEGKEPHEMTSGELAEAIAKMEAAAAALAKPINAEVLEPSVFE